MNFRRHFESQLMIISSFAPNEENRQRSHFLVSLLFVFPLSYIVKSTFRQNLQIRA